MNESTELITNLRIAAYECTVNAQNETTRAAMFESLVERLVNGVPGTSWAWPVGTPEHPSEDWYAYTVHDLTGRRNPQNYGHTGLDLNLDIAPHGNVDVGQPVYAVTDGEVVSVGFSERFRGGVVVKVDHFGVDLFVRYWHLTDWTTANLGIYTKIAAGQQIGKIDKYPGGYAHCHFDMAWQPFEHNWWWTYHPEVEWANPVYILKAHLDPERVDKMLARGG